MSQPLYKIRKLIKELPDKDSVLAEKFLNERNFQGILELVDSDIYKARKEEDAEDSDINELLALKVNLEEYMSFLDVPEDDYDDYI